MKTTLFLLLMFIQAPLFGQFNCKTTKQSDGSEVKTCCHQNGKVSIIETWDKDKRSGSLKGFDNQGKELFSLALRHYGGHASALLTWYPNGQVKSVAYSDAPDAGIQYYHATTLFDEAGNQTSFTEDSYDDSPGRVLQKMVIRDTVKPRKPLVEINRVLEKPGSKRLDFLIVNKTKSKQRITLDYVAFGSDTVLNIAAKQEVYQTIFPDTNEQKLKQIPELNVFGNTKRFEIIRGKEETFDDHITVTWYIIKS